MERIFKLVNWFEFEKKSHERQAETFLYQDYQFDLEPICKSIMKFSQSLCESHLYMNLF